MLNISLTVGTVACCIDKVIPPAEGRHWKVLILVYESDNVVSELGPVGFADSLGMVAEAIGALLPNTGVADADSSSGYW